MYQGKFDQKYKTENRDMPALRHPSGIQPKPISKPAPKPVPVPKARGPRLSGVIFYLLFFLYILLFYLAVFLGMTMLRGWLVDYEAAQPTRKCQEVFSTLFDARNWDALYDAVGIQDETREAFVSYMEETVGDRELTCMATSAGLSDDRKYNVRLGNTTIASFTLTDKNNAQTAAALPDWQLADVTFFFTAKETYFVEKPAGAIAYVNGIALDDSHTIRIRTTKAEAYLPEGTAAPGTQVQQTPGHIAKPDVTVMDTSGTQLPLTYDEQTHTFTVQTEAAVISEEEKETALNAVKTYALYMIEKAGADDVAQYFEKGTDTYTAIIRTDRSSVQDAQSRKFVDETVTDYCRYSDGLFSVRVSMTLNLYRSGGSVKESAIAQSLFFRKQEGKWKCFQMTVVDISAPVERVRLTFMDGGTQLWSGFWEADASQLTCPAVSVPEGKTFSGWMVKEQDASGQTVHRLMFQPDENNIVYLSGNTPLEPMTLYPLFEDAE